ncbi:MAG TPA: hypothetical protein VLJ57_23985 [Burkholderiaceae bacterium]|nr:hypothetical protein [Burkholderiaceae bacterium]
MRFKYLLLVASIFIAFAITVVWRAEVYTVVADAELPVRRIANQADSAENVLLVLKPGQKLNVTDCIDYKSDVAVQVSVSKDLLGYVSDGDFHLERVRWPYKFFVSSPKRLVWSCGAFFNDRKIDF